MRFKEKLLKCAEKNSSWLCIGLDPDVDKLPPDINKDPNGVARFLKAIIDATKDLVCAYKPNSAFYEQFGAAGLALLKDVIKLIPDEIPVILDAKRGDIGNTSRMYAVSAFEHLGADAVTVNPYMGYDCTRPFLEYQDKGVFVLCLTSNPSSVDFQKQIIAGDMPAMMYELVAEKAISWNKNDNIGLVAGATKPTELERIREIAGDDIPILIPGVGAQGGDLEASLRAGGNSKGRLAIINASRSVLYASAGEDYADRSRASALNLVSAMRKLL